jgi:hypothetical protein
MKKERRKLERFDLALPATIQLVTPNREKEKRIRNLFTTNISEDGAFIPTPQPLPERSEVKLNLVLPLSKMEKIKEDRAHIRVKGVVLRSELEGMAIRFHKGYKISPQ